MLCDTEGEARKKYLVGKGMLGMTEGTFFPFNFKRRIVPVSPRFELDLANPGFVFQPGLRSALIRKAPYASFSIPF